MKIKVCGMKFPENISQISDLNPDYLGFIFYEDSPRNFIGDMPKFKNDIKKVGVFVNEPISDIKNNVRKYNLVVVQLHGNETVEYCSNLKFELPEIEIWKAFSVDDQFDFEKLKLYDIVDKFLLDTKGENVGGNGVKFNWDILKRYDLEKEIILSGGISPEDFNEIFELAKQIPQIKIIDINSRFETKPGIKNVQSVKQFINEIQLRNESI